MSPYAGLIHRSRQGDRAALEELIEPHRPALFAYIFRMVAQRQDAEDLVQEVFIRAIQSVGSYRGESSIRTWLYGIATHACLDHLRSRKRWRVEAQLAGEEETVADPQKIGALQALVTRPDFRFELREHIAFCFTCIGRTLPPEEQAALLLREVFGFSAQEAAQILGVSEPVSRHRLSAARASMIAAFDGLCQLINKTGRCYQCSSLREMTPEANRGDNLIRIEVAPGVAVTPDSLLDARIAITRDAGLEHGRSRLMHDAFFAGNSAREQSG
ncbi:MAG: RNA polymerase sigma factor [Bryobacteraceae bacterium]